MNKKYIPSALILYLNYFIHGVGCSILGQAVIKEALAASWGVEVMAITAISAALGLGRLIALPFAGPLSDKLGRRISTAIGSGSYAIYLIGLALAYKAGTNGGYQIAQSLFAIGSGGWFGTGLFKGQPDTIPVSAEDFIFTAISEEMGLIYAMCLILICVSCYVMFLNIAMQLHNLFYKMVALGLGTCYIFQVFLTIGGATKFIPSTGVTLPLVSYGGSSLISTLIMFAIIQGLYILREDEEEDIERRKKERLRAKRSRQENAARYQETEYDPQRAKRSQKARKEAAQGKARKKQRIR